MTTAQPRYASNTPGRKNPRFGVEMVPFFATSLTFSFLCPRINSCRCFVARCRRSFLALKFRLLDTQSKACTRDVSEPDRRGVLHGALVRRNGVAQLLPDPAGVPRRHSMERSPPAWLYQLG